MKTFLAMTAVCLMSDPALFAVDALVNSSENEVVSSPKPIEPKLEEWTSPITGEAKDETGYPIEKCEIAYEGIIKIADYATREAYLESERREDAFWARAPFSKAEFEKMIKGSSLTDQKGSFTTASLPLPVKFPNLVYYSITARCAGFISEMANFVRPGEDHLSFVLRKGLKLDGRVTDKNTSKPLKGITIAVDIRDNPAVNNLSADSSNTVNYEPCYWLYADTDEKGRFFFDGLPPGLVRVSVWEVPSGYFYDDEKLEVETGAGKPIEFKNVYKKSH